MPPKPQQDTRNPARIDTVLRELERAWRANPGMRLGQLIVNAAGVSDPFYVEDVEIIKGLKSLGE